MLTPRQADALIRKSVLGYCEQFIPGQLDQPEISDGDRAALAEANDRFIREVLAEATTA